MKETIITAPEGIRYLSEWTDFENQIPHGQHFILNKAHTGVGATQYYLSNPQKVILCSPRVSLIENKRAKHPNVWIYRDLSDNSTSDTNGKSQSKKKATFEDIQRYNSEVVQYVHRCLTKGETPKLMTTYDSIGHIIDALTLISPNELDSWTVVVDEFQAIFGDATYKSLTEMQLLSNTAKFKTVIYLSATPFLEKYMDEIDEFKNLPYIELKWPDEMVEAANVLNITLKKGNSPIKECRKIIETMKNGKTVRYGNKEIDTTEAVFYVNMVKDICSIIKKSGLKPEEYNVLCSESNRDFLKKEGITIGSIPAEGEPHKQFTFCTRAYFLGCDFNSECAYSFIFADPKSRTLALDLSTDLSQILGRQRLDRNPFRNEAILFIKEGAISISDKEFQDYIEEKKKATEELISIFNGLNDQQKKAMIKVYRSNIEKKHYSDDYLCIKNDQQLEVGFNSLYMWAEIRAWEIRRKNYTSQYEVIRQQKVAGIKGSIGTKSSNPEVLAFKASFESTPNTGQRIKLYSEFRKDHPELIEELDFVPRRYNDYWDALGYEWLKKVGFQESKIKAIMAEPSPFEDKVITEIRQLVEENKEYTPAKMKDLLGQAYKKAGIKRKAKANEIDKYLTASLKQEKKTGTRKYVINSIFQKNISFFPHVWLPNRHKEITIDRFLDIIQKGTYSTSKGQQNRNLADVITEIRGKTNPDEISKMKKDWLPVAIINGVFETKHDHSITTYSSFVALDYDHFADDVAKEKAKDHLKQFPFVYAIFETPSGHGIKAIILHDSVNPEHHFNLFAQLLKACSLPEIDNVGSDISRGQFFSYDPGLWRNPSPEAFHFEYDPSITPPSPKKEMSVNGEKGIVKLDSGTTAFLHKLWEMILTDDAVIERLDKHWHEHKPEYFKVGNRHSGLLVITGTLCKAGIPQEKAKAYLDKTYSNMPASEIDSILSYAYNHNPFGSDRRKYGRW